MHDLLDNSKTNLNSEQMQDSIIKTPAASSAKRNSFYHLFLRNLMNSFYVYN